MIKTCKNSVVLLSAVMSFLTVSACQKPIDSRPQVVAPPDRVSLLLAESAERASEALKTLASVEEKRTPVDSPAQISDAPPELRRAITINWVGPVEPLVEKLANRAGYSFMTYGNPPPTALVVNMDAYNTAVIDLMRDVGLQLGQKADLRVDANTKSVELHYIPLNGMSGG